MNQALLRESSWRVFHPGFPSETLARVTYLKGSTGDSGSVMVEAASSEVKDFLVYYLEDPLDQHPAYKHGLGQRSGPHTNDLDQFDWVMAALQRSSRRLIHAVFAPARRLWAERGTLAQLGRRPLLVTTFPP